jgi:hypothetical protein
MGMSRFLLRLTHWKAFVAAGVALTLGAGLILALESTGQRGIISGHVYRCDFGTGSPNSRACAPGEPVSGVRLRFEQVDGSRSFVVVSNSTGAYLVRVDSGTYVAKWEVIGSARYNDAGHVDTGDWGVPPFSVRPGQHIVLDLTTRAFSQ